MNPTNEQMERASHGLMQLIEDAKAFNQEWANVCMSAFSSMTKGLNETASNASVLMQEHLARTVSAGKSMSATRNPRELMDLQVEYMKECIECFVNGSGKLSEISARTTKEVIEPVAQHANATMSKLADKASRAA